MESEVSSYSTTAVLANIILTVLSIGMAYQTLPSSALLPIIYCPALLAAWKHSGLRRREAGNDNVMGATCTLTNISHLVIGKVQAYFAPLVFWIVFGDQGWVCSFGFRNYTDPFAPRRDTLEPCDVAHTSRYRGSLAIISYIGVGLFEEAIKYLALRLAIWRAHPRHEREYMIYAIAAGLGYSISENLSPIYWWILHGETGTMLALRLFEGLTFGTIGHTAMALLIAIQSIRRDARSEKLPLWRILLKPVLYHGTWYYCLLLTSARSDKIGFDHPAKMGRLYRAWTLLAMVQGIAVWDVLRQLKRLKLKDVSVERDLEQS